MYPALPCNTAHSYHPTGWRYVPATWLPHSSQQLNGKWILWKQNWHTQILASKSILHYGFITPLHHCKAFTHMAVLRPLVVWQEGCISPEMAPLSFIASILELGHACHASLALSSHLPLTHWNPSVKTRSSLKNQNKIRKLNMELWDQQSASLNARFEKEQRSNINSMIEHT